VTIMANRTITAWMDAAGPQGPRPAGTPVAFVARMAAGKQAVGELLIYDEIAWYAITSASIAAALADLQKQGASELHVYVNSPGGDVFEGVAIYNSLRRFAGRKTVFVDGLAASMASVIAMAGDRIVTAPNAMWMVHNPWSIVAGDGAALRARADLLDELAKSCVSAYAARTGRSADELKGWMDAESWMGPEVALARGFTDEIAPEAVASSAEASAPDLWPTFAKFKSAPPEALRLLSIRASARTPAATSRTMPAEPALTPRKEQTMDLKALLAKAVAAGLITQADADKILADAEHKTEADPRALTVEAQIKALTARLEQLAAATQRPASDPSANLVADAAAAANEAPRAAAPRISRYATPRAFAGREQRSDEAASPRMRAALPLARLAMATVLRKETGAPLAEAAAMLGFQRVAERIDSVARGAAMSAGDANAGGSFIPTDFQEGYIDMLDERPGAIMALIPTSNRYRSVLPTIQVPTITGGVSGGWVGENPSTGNPEGLTTGAKTLSAKKQRIEVLISRDWLRSVGNGDQIVLEKMLQRSMQLDELAVVEGTGAGNTPRGLETLVTQTSAMTASPDYEKARGDGLKLLKTLATAKVPTMGGRAFVIPEQAKWGLMGFINPAGSDHPFEKELLAGRWLGQQAAFSTLIGTDKVYCVEPSEMLWLEQLDMFIENDNVYLDSSGNAKIASGSDQTVIRLFRKVDFDLAHTEAVAVKTGITWGA
jgi:HK97 family phage major capsid protein